LERNYHNAASVEKFDRMVEGDYLGVAFRNEGVIIYGVEGQGPG